MASITCPACKRRLRVVDALPGDALDCPACGHTFTLDGGSTPAIRAEPPPVPTSAPGPSSAGQWWGRLGISGRVMLIAALVGLLSCLLPAVSVSGSSAFGGIQVNQSAIVGSRWQGSLGMIGFIAIIVLCFILHGPQPMANKALYWVPVGIAGVVVMLALLWLVEALRASQSISVGGMANYSITPGVGVFVYLLAAGAVLVGAILKVRQERLI